MRRRRTSRVRRGWTAVAGLLVLAAGCSHTVKPTERYRRPESIPTPADVTAVQEAGAILLSWAATATIFDVVDGWNVYRKTTMEGTPIRINAALLTDVQYRDAAVSEGQSYFYSVRSVSPAGVESRGSHDLEVRFDTVPPAAPTALTAISLPNAIRLTWAASGTADFGWYNLYRDASLLATPLLQAEYADMPVAPGSTHVYEVAAVDDRGNESPRSQPISAQSLPASDTTTPGIPDGLALALEPDGIRLSWNPVSDPDLSGYLAYRRTSGVPAFARVPGTGLLAGPTLLDAQVQNGVTYEYAVTAVDSSGNESGLSAVALLQWVARSIDTGGTSLGSVYPWCGIAANSGRMQFLVPASDLNRAGTLDTLALWIRSGAAVYQNVSVSLAHTSLNALGADFAANRASGDAAISVFGPATIDSERDRRGAILPLPLTSGFVYDGARALLVEIAWSGDDGRTVVFAFGSSPDARRRLWQQPDGGGSSGHELNQQFLRFTFAP